MAVTAPSLCRKGWRVVLVTALALLAQGPAAADGLPDIPPQAVKWPALPYALSIATPRWEIDANGTKSIATMSVYGGSVSFKSGYIAPVNSNVEVEMALVAIGKYDRVHRITCKAPGAIKAYVTTRNTLNGQVITSPEKIYNLSGQPDAKFDVEMTIQPKLTFLTVKLKSGLFAECAVRVASQTPG